MWRVHPLLRHAGQALIQCAVLLQVGHNAANEVQAAAYEHGARASVVPSIEDAMAQARAAGASAEEPAAVLVCGSLHLVGGVMAHLQQHGALDERLASMT